MDTENPECVICTENIFSTKDYAITSCQHSFHLSCLFQIQKNECPLCRKAIFVRENMRIITPTHPDIIVDDSVVDCSRKIFSIIFILGFFSIIFIGIFVQIK